MKTYRIDYQDRNDRGLEVMAQELARVAGRARQDSTRGPGSPLAEVQLAEAKLERVRQQLQHLKQLTRTDDLAWGEARQDFERAKLELREVLQAAAEHTAPPS